MKKNKFDIIIFIGRPAAGKSEVIDFLKSLKISERQKLFHIANIVEIDDFKFLWKRGLIDDKREKKGLQRKDTLRIKVGGYIVKSRDIYKKLINDINRFFLKNYNLCNFFKKNTLFIEFSRGGYNGYRESLSLLNKDILKKAVIFYIKVSFKEAVRKNKKRYKPNKEDSILYHIVPFKVMNKYKTDDWEKITLSDSKYITIKGKKVFYAVFNNEPEKTNNIEKIRKELLINMDKLLKNYKGGNL